MLRYSLHECDLALLKVEVVEDQYTRLELVRTSGRQTVIVNGHLHSSRSSDVVALATVEVPKGWMLREGRLTEKDLNIISEHCSAGKKLLIALMMPLNPRLRAMVY